MHFQTFPYDLSNFMKNFQCKIWEIVGFIHFYVSNSNVSICIDLITSKYNVYLNAT